MPEWLIGLIALGIIAGITLFILWRKKKQKAADKWKYGAWVRAKAIIDSTQPAITPAGHKMYKEPKVTNLNPGANDLGMEDTFEKCECAGYPVDRSRHRVSTVIVESIPDSQGDPCYKEFIAPGNPYYGSEWDGEAGKGQEVDHYVKVAGQTVAVGDPFGDIIVIPEHTANQVDHQRIVTGFEAEHFTLAQYDGPEFERTKYHLTGGHPVIPACVPELGAVRSRYKAAHWAIKDGEGIAANEIYVCALLTK